MERDDLSFEGQVVFFCLLLLNVPILCFSLWRIYSHWKAARSCPALITFYAILCVLLCCRVTYYLDIFAHYPDWLYFALDLLPVVFIFCAGSVVSYIWCDLPRCDISINFLYSFDSLQRPKRMCLSMTLVLNAIFLLSISLAYIGFYLFNTSNTTMYPSPSAIRIIDVFFCCVTAVLLCLTGRSVSVAIMVTLHRSTPKRVRTMQITTVKYLSTSSLCFRAIINLFFLLTEVTTSDLQAQAPTWFWAIFVFVFYFVLETLLMLVFLALIHVQMKEKKEAAMGEGERQTALCDVTDSSFSVSGVFTTATDVRKVLCD